jgi:hypothetical protein
MNMRQDPERLELLIGGVLRGQPPLRAPASLQARVLGELALRAALPWWRKSFVYWPLGVRGLFILACAGLVRLALLGTTWVFEAASSPTASVRSTARVAASLGEAGSAVLGSFPSEWLYLGAAFGLGLYMLLFGLGATAYRTLYK